MASPESSGIKIEVQTRKTEIKPHTPIPVAWALSKEVALRIHRNTLDYQTSGPCYKLKSVPIKGTDEKYEYYAQKDSISGETIFFKIRLKKNLDITSILSEPPKIQIDRDYNNKIFYLVIGIMAFLELLTILFFVGPPELAYTLEPYLNLPTLSGWLLSSLLAVLLLYYKATLVTLYTGNFRIIAEYDEPLNFVLARRVGIFKLSHEIREVIQGTYRVFELKLLYSEKATMEDVFGHGPEDIAKQINEALQKENLALKEALQRLSSRITILERQLNITKVEMDKAKDAIRNAYFKGAMSTLKQYETVEREEQKPSYIQQLLERHFPLLALLATVIVIIFSPAFQQFQYMQLDPISATILGGLSIIIIAWLINSWIKTREYKRIEVKS